MHSLAARILGPAALAVLVLTLLTPVATRTPVAAGEAGLAHATATQSPAAGRITFRAPRDPVAVGTRIRLEGRVPGARRRVSVQRRDDRGRWHRVSTKRAGRRGHYEFRLRVRAPGRVLLRSVAHAHRGRPRLRSVTRVVDAVQQRGTMTSIPPLAAPGRAPSVPTATAQVLATFTPPLPGKVVRLQRRGKRGWRHDDTGRQNLAGSVAFPAVPGARYRALVSPRTSTGAVTARAFELRFAEDFSTTAPDGRSPDPATWVDQFRPNPSGRTCSVNDPTLRSVGGGVLHLRVGPHPSPPSPTCSYVHQGEAKTSPWLLNTQVATAKSFSFTHGYAAARIKMHSHSGAHASFWMLPSKTVPDDHPEWHDVSFVPGDPSRGAEIDIVEYWANPPSPQAEPMIGSFVHWYGVDGDQSSWGYLFPGANQLRRPGATWDDSFHVFSVRWTPKEYVFMVDGQVHARDSRAVSQVPQHLVLSMLAGDYELDRVGPGLFADSAEVDWVRVWGL